MHVSLISASDLSPKSTFVSTKFVYESVTIWQNGQLYDPTSTPLLFYGSSPLPRMAQIKRIPPDAPSQKQGQTWLFSKGITERNKSEKNSFETPPNSPLTTHEHVGWIANCLGVYQF